MTRYMLDTNIVSDLIRNPQGKVALRLAEVGGRMATGTLDADESEGAAAPVPQVVLCAATSPLVYKSVPMDLVQVTVFACLHETDRLASRLLPTLLRRHRR